MKRLLLLLSLSTIIYVSCSKTQQSDPDMSSSEIETLHNDKVFQDYLLYSNRQVANITDVGLLKSYLEDGQLSQKEQNIIHKVFGYENNEYFWNEFAEQTKRVLQSDDKNNP